MLLKMKFVRYVTKMHTMLVILLGNYFSDVLKWCYNVTVFAYRKASSNKFATSLR